LRRRAFAPRNWVDKVRAISNRWFDFGVMGPISASRAPEREERNMRRRELPDSSIWRLIGVPAAQWLSLTGLLVVLSLILAGGINPHKLMEGELARRASGARSPFDLESLRQRLPPPAIDRIQRFITYYQQNRKRGFREALARSTRYLEEFKQIFRDSGLPEELAFLPLIESGFIETAVSPMNAVGVWQFLEETGRRYDLKSTRWFDQKLDPIHSARAAAKFLGHLYETFGDWELALAAYNSGEGTVRWAVRSAQKAKTPTDFWHLDVPDETKAYVPAFLAAMLIAKNPSAYGFEEIDFHPQLVYEQIKVNPGIPLDAVAAQFDTDPKQLRELNPALVAGVTPPGANPYLLRVPHGVREQLPERLGAQKLILRDWLVHQVQAQDTLQRLAAKFRSDAELIKQVNGIGSNSDLSPGLLIIIPL
jgi:membrane-bound lytic murein transglycosylase D